MGTRVLVVEDDPDTREAPREFLRSCGHDVAVAADGREAIAITLDRAPDVVVVDIGLPDIDGYEVAQRIRSAPGGGSPYLVALTGSDEDAASRAAAFDAYVVKPADPDALRALMERRRPAVLRDRA